MYVLSHHTLRSFLEGAIFLKQMYCPTVQHIVKTLLVQACFVFLFFGLALPGIPDLEVSPQIPDFETFLMHDKAHFQDLQKTTEQSLLDLQ